MNKFPDFGTIRYDIAQFLKQSKSVLKPPVLQVGSKRMFEDAWWANQRELLGYPKEDWVGLDLEDGPGVDVVCDFCARPRPLVRSPESLSYIQDEFYGSVLIAETLEHAEDPLNMLDNAYDVLRPDGWIVVTTPFVCHVHNHPHDFWRFTTEGLFVLLNRAGFTDILTTPSPGKIVYETADHDENEITRHAVPHGTFGVGRKPRHV